MSEPELKPCPWPHERQDTYEYARLIPKDADGEQSWFMATVVCRVCGAQGPNRYHDSQAEAVVAACAAWNSYSVATCPPNVSPKADSAPIFGESPADCTQKGIASHAETRDGAMDAG